MKSLKLLALLLTMLALCASLAWSQDAFMVIKSKELTHKRTLVTLTHAQHEAVVDCKVCHHDFFQFNKKDNSEGTPCGECHKANPGAKDNPVSLQKAYHQRCQSCHVSLLKQAKATGPIMCRDCHMERQETAKK